MVHKANQVPFYVKDEIPYAYGQALSPLEPIRVEYYRQEVAPKNVPEIEGAKLEQFYFEYNGEKIGQGGKQLSYRQFHALYSAVGAKVGWWPLDDPQFDICELFSGAQLFVLKDENVPIGFSAISSDYNGQDGQGAVMFVGIIPSRQGKGYGKSLFVNVVDYLWKKGVHSIVLHTAPDFDRMGTGPSASSLYQRCGFVCEGAEIRMPTPGYLQEINVPEFYIREEQVHRHVDGGDGYTFHEKRLFEEFGL